MSVYRVIDVIGTSPSSWEEPAAEAITTAAEAITTAADCAGEGPGGAGSGQ